MQPQPILQSPYVGLMPYTEDQADLFFGRDKETRLISSKLYASRLTLLYGPSGVGKSSILRAGVVHSLRQEEGAAVFYFNTWQSDPIAMLRTQIGGEIPILLTARSEPTASPQAEFSDRLRLAPTLGDFFKVAVELVGPLMIILDQFEEYFLYHPRDDANEPFAIEFAKSINRDDVRANFLVALREDSYTKMGRFKGRIPNLFGNYVHLDHLGVEAARAAIEKPIEKYNAQHSVESPITIESALVDAVLDQVRTGQVVIGERGSGIVTADATSSQIETPFLQMVMTRLWDEETTSGSRVLRLATLNRLGGADKIVRTHLDTVMAQLKPSEQEICSLFFDRLVTPSGTKIAQTNNDLVTWTTRSTEQVAPILKSLVNARVLRNVAPPIDQPTAVRYEIFHDVLAPAVLDWQQRFLQQQARKKEAARVRRLSLALLGAVLLIVAFAGLAFFAFQQQRIGLARELAASAIANLNVDPERSILLSINSLNVAHVPEGEDALRQSIFSSLLRITLRGHTDIVWNVVYSPTGKQIITPSNDGTARIWDTTNGKLITTLPGHAGAVWNAIYSPDGKRVVTTSEDKKARLWDAATGQLLSVWQGHTKDVWGGAFNPDGSKFVTASLDGKAIIWDVTSGRSLFVLQGHTDEVLCALFSPDGKLVLTTSKDQTARLWDAATGALLKILKHSGSVIQGGFSPDGKQIVTASGDQTIGVWDTVTGNSIRALRGHSDSVLSVSFSPDASQIVSTSADNTARLWDAKTGQNIAVLRGHTNWVLVAFYSPDSKTIITASLDQTARIWEASTGRNLGVLRGHTGAVEKAAFSPDGKHVATASRDATARIWDLPPFREVNVLVGHTDTVFSVAFSPDNQWILTGSNDGSARLWNASTGAEVRALRNPDAGEVWRAAFSPDGKQIVTANQDATARIWDTASGKQLQILNGHDDRVWSAAFSADGKRIVTASDDGTARIWDASTGKLVRVLQGDWGAVYDASFSPDGKQVVIAAEKKIARVFDAETGQSLATLSGHNNVIFHAVFSPDSKRVLTASFDNTARIWDATTGKELVVLRGHSDWVRSAAFSANGRQIVTVSSDGTARIWDASNGQELTNLQGQSDAAFSPDGKKIVTGGSDRTALIYLANLDDLLGLAKQRVTRDLTCEEKLKFLHDAPCPAPTPTPTSLATTPPKP